MSEPLQMLLMASFSFLFALGGYHEKAWRRFGIPIVACSVLMFLVTYKFAFAYSIAIMIALHQGYGEKTPYWKKFLVFCGYSLPALMLGFTWWAFVTPLILILLFFLSNCKPTANMIFWKLWEFIAGLLTAVCLIDALTK